MCTHRQALRSVGASHAYNLLEILLALIVVVVGVIGVMALLPVSQQTNRHALGQVNAADAGDQFARVLASKLKINWDLSTALPVSRPLADEAGVVFTLSDSGQTLHAITGVQIYYDDRDGDGRLDYSAGDRDDSGIFKLVQRTSPTVGDFSAVVRVWREAATYRYYDARTNHWAVKAVDPSSGIELNLELSYPAELPYEARQKHHLSLNVFRPRENPAFGYIFAGTLDELNLNLPPELGISGALNLSPNNSGDLQEFYLQTPTGSITRDTLKAWHNADYKGPNKDFIYYDGPALAVYFQPKGNGNDNNITLHGTVEAHGFGDEPIEILNGRAYHVTSQQLSVRIYQGQGAGLGQSDLKKGGKTNMGHWWVAIDAHDAVISVLK